MRTITCLLLLLFASLAGAAVTDKAIDVSGAKSALIEKQWTETLTGTEQTLTVTIGSEDRKIQIYTKVYAWGLANASGLYATKKPIDPSQVDTITIVAAPPGTGTTTRVFYWQAASTTDTIYISVVE